MSQAVQQAVPCLTKASKLLLKLRFVQKPKKCLICGGSSLERAVARQVQKGIKKKQVRKVLSVRCKSRACRSHNNCVHYGAFRGLRMSTSELLRALHAYSVAPQARAPCARQLERSTGLGRKQLEHVVSTVRTQESAAGQASSQRQVLHGDLEGDGCCLRRWSFFAHSVAWSTCLFICLFEPAQKT